MAPDARRAALTATLAESTRPVDLYHPHRLDGGLPSGCGSLVPHEPDLRAQPVLFEGVHVLAETVRQGVPDPAVLPCSRAHRQKRQLGGGIGGVGGRAPVLAPVLADGRPLLVVDFQRVGP